MGARRRQETKMMARLAGKMAMLKTAKEEGGK